MAALSRAVGSNAVPINNFEFAVLSYDVVVHIYNVRLHQWRLASIDHRYIHAGSIRDRDHAFLWHRGPPEYIQFDGSNNALFAHNANGRCCGLIPLAQSPRRECVPSHWPKQCHPACHTDWRYGGLVGCSFIRHQSQLNIYVEGNVHLFRSRNSECHHAVIVDALLGADDLNGHGALLGQSANFVDLSAFIPGGSKQDFIFKSVVHCKQRNSLIVCGEFTVDGAKYTFAEISVSTESPKWDLWTPHEQRRAYSDPVDHEWMTWRDYFDWSTVIAANERFLMWIFQSRFVIYDLHQRSMLPKISALLIPTEQSKYKQHRGRKLKKSLVIMTDEHTDMLCAAGFVREFYRRPEMEDRLLPPVYIVEMFSQFMGTEYVHVLMKGSKTHWRVRMVEILRTAAPIELVLGCLTGGADDV